jgi:DNA-binding CsgD family transcriptional regulator
LKALNATLAKAGIKAQPTLLGLGLIYTVILIILESNSPLITDLDFALGSAFAKSALIGAIVAALLLVLSGKLLRPWLFALRQLHFSTNRYLLQGFILISLLIFIAGLILLCVSPHETTALLIASGMLCGVGCLFMLTSWGAAFARTTPQDVLLHGALSFGLAVLLYLLIALPALYTQPAIPLALLSTASTALLLRCSMTDDKDVSTQKTDSFAPATNSIDRISVLTSLKTLLEALWKPLVGATISAFIMGLVWDYITAESEYLTISMENATQMLFAPLLTTVLIVIALLRHPKNFTLHIFCEAALPVAIVILLVQPVIDVENPLIIRILTYLSNMGFSVVAITTWSSLVSNARTVNLAAWLVVPASCSLFAAANLLGRYLIGVISTGGRLLCLIVLTVFLVLMVLEFALKGRTQKQSRELSRDIFEKYLHNRCSVLSAKHGLSARESEILIYLARGYSHVFIAKELYVSENTVRTHVKHIYSKLSLGSREELLKLIDSP